MSEPSYEAGVVVGNTYDKYGTWNPIARLLVRGFLSSFDGLAARASPRTVLEVGCGEGELSIRLAKMGHQVLGTDISKRMIRTARRRAEREHSIDFRQANLFDLDAAEGVYDLVVCCEVLEHLSEPQDAIRHLVTLSRSTMLFSVPREPAWRALNVVRGRYLRDLGNTPGHVQHWSRRAFLRLLGSSVPIIAEASPFPWTMVLCGVPQRHPP